LGRCEDARDDAGGTFGVVAVGKFVAGESRGLAEARLVGVEHAREVAADEGPERWDGGADDAEIDFNGCP